MYIEQYLYNFVKIFIPRIGQRKNNKKVVCSDIYKLLFFVDGTSLQLVEVSSQI